MFASLFFVPDLVLTDYFRLMQHSEGVNSDATNRTYPSYP